MKWSFLATKKKIPSILNVPIIQKHFLDKLNLQSQRKLMFSIIILFIVLFLGYFGFNRYIERILSPKNPGMISQTGNSSTTPEDLLATAFINTSQGRVNIDTVKCIIKTNINLQKNPEKTCLSWIKEEVKNNAYPSENHIYYLNDQKLTVYDIKNKMTTTYEYNGLPSINTTERYYPTIFYADNKGALIGNEYRQTYEFNGLMIFDRNSENFTTVFPVENCEGEECSASNYAYMGVFDNNFYFAKEKWDPKNEGKPGQAWNTFYLGIFSFNQVTFDSRLVLSESDIPKGEYPYRATKDGNIYFNKKSIEMTPNENASSVYSINDAKFISDKNVNVLQINVFSILPKDFKDYLGTIIEFELTPLEPLNSK